MSIYKIWDWKSPFVRNTDKLKILSDHIISSETCSCLWVWENSHSCPPLFKPTRW